MNKWFIGVPSKSQFNPDFFFQLRYATATAEGIIVRFLTTSDTLVDHFNMAAEFTSRLEAIGAAILVGQKLKIRLEVFGID